MREDDMIYYRAPALKETLSSEEELVRPGSKRNLKQTFSSLIDTMRDAQRMQERKEKIQEIEEKNKRQNASLDKLRGEFTNVVMSHQDALGTELPGETSLNSYSCGPGSSEEKDRGEILYGAQG